jgi:predicted dehydrogenase
MYKKKKLKCVVFGYGYMGQIRHRVISSNSNLELIGIFDRDKSNLKDTNKNLIIEKYLDIKNIDFDIAFVCTPNNVSPNLVVDCLKLNKHVFCEKPPGKNIKDLFKIKKQIKPNLKLMFGFNHRFHPAVLKANEFIKNDTFGKIVNIRGVYGKSGGQNFKKSWRNDPKVSGGGILLDQGIHMIDLFRFFCGNFNQIKCFSSNSFWKFKVEDNAFLILKNKINQIAFLHSSSTLWRHTFRIDITLETGFILIEGLLSKTGSYGQEKITFGKRQFENVSKAVGNPSEKVIYFDKDNSWDLEVKQFIDFIYKNNKVNINSFEDAYQSMLLVEKAYKQK